MSGEDEAARAARATAYARAREDHAAGWDGYREGMRKLNEPAAPFRFVLKPFLFLPSLNRSRVRFSVV
jgi:hypothetical protein